MMSTAITASECRNWLELPADVMARILLKVGTVDIIESAQQVCVSWRRICKDSSMWRRIDMRHPWKRKPDSELEKICRHAVDRSDGQLIDIDIAKFATDKLLHYITQRSSRLKHLRLVMCYGISDKGLIKAAAKLSLLEELELTNCPISKEALKTVGKSCRLLNSFKFNRLVTLYGACDDEAFAIAENMPGLRHLQLVGNMLTDNGLKAILSGCIKVKSLDLRRCCYLRLKGNFGKTCVDQVKSLKLPYKLMNNYPYAIGSTHCGYSDEDEDDYPFGFDVMELYSFGQGGLESKKYFDYDEFY